MHPLLTQVDAVFFDLDGTLVDSATDIHAALNHVLNVSALGSVTEMQVRNWIGRGAKVLVESALSFLGVNESQYAAVHEDFLAYYSDHVYQQTRLYDDVLKLLQSLKNEGKILACITNKPINAAHILLEALGIAQYFSLVLGGDSLAKRKPDPLPLQHALTHFNLTPSQAVMVGDSRYDIFAAKAAGMQSLAHSKGYNAGESVSLCEPTIVFDGYAELLL